MISEERTTRGAEIRWLRELRREAEHQAERHGPLRGRIRPAQIRWSWAGDVIEQAEQEAAA